MESVIEFLNRYDVCFDHENLKISLTVDFPIISLFFADP